MSRADHVCAALGHHLVAGLSFDGNADAVVLWGRVCTRCHAWLVAPDPDDPAVIARRVTLDALEDAARRLGPRALAAERELLARGERVRASSARSWRELRVRELFAVGVRAPASFVVGTDVV